MKTTSFESLVKTADLRLYGTFRRRTLFFKVLSAVLALQMFFVGAVPFSAVAGGNLPEMSGGYKTGMNVDGNTLTITGAAGSSFNWDRGFNIGADYTVQFQGIGTAVNKDTSGSRSDIFGALKSDGAVYILNPNGILFGSSARVDVHGLVAAAAGSVSGGPDNMTFSKLGSGSVVNQGRISAGEFAYLVGKSVENRGSISAGTVALAAFGGKGADSLTIASSPNGAKITFHIPGETDEADGDDAEDGETNGESANGESNANGEANANGESNGNGESGNGGESNGNGESGNGGESNGNGESGNDGDAGANSDVGGNVISAGVITGAANEQAGDATQGNSGDATGGKTHGSLRGNPDPIPDPVEGTVNIAIAGADIEIDTSIDDAAVKNVNIEGNSVKIGKDGGAVTVKANDGSVKIDAADFINVLKDATITAQKGDTADAANVTMTTTGGDITMGGTITADDGITLDAGGGAIGIAGNVTAATLTLKSATGITAGTTQAATISSDGKTLTVQGENTAIIADHIDGHVQQQGGSIKAKTGTLVFDSTVEQSGGQIGGGTIGDGGIFVQDNVEITGALTQTAGQIDAKTLTLAADGNTVAGRINADAIAGGKSIEVTGDVNADSITADLMVKDGGAVDTKNGTGTLAITGELKQYGGAIATEAGENLTVSGLVNHRGGTIGNETGEITLMTQFDQYVEVGKNAAIVADKLYLKEGGTIDNQGESHVTVSTLLDASGKTLTVRGGEIRVDEGEIKAATLNVSISATSESKVVAKNITVSDKIDQSIGSIEVAETITGNVEQKAISYGTSLSAQTIDGALTQAEGNQGVVTVGAVTGATVQNDGKILKANGAEKLDFGSTVTQNGGQIGATDNISIAGALTQAAGATINATTLTFGADGNAVAGQVNADAIAGGKTVEVQDGGDVNVDSIVASTLTVKDGGAVDTKDGTGTLAITGDLVQDGGDIATTAGENVTVSGATAQNGGTLGNATGTVGLDGALTQNGDNAKLYASTLTLKGGATQTKGVVEAATLDMQNADADVTLAQSGNKFGTIGGKAKDATINDSADGLAIDDLEGANLTLTAAGDVTQVAGKTVKATGLADITSTAGNILITAANNELTSFKGTAEGAGKAVKVVNAKALEVQGITAGTTASRGDILVKATGNSGTINITTAPVSGNNVTLSASKGITEGYAVNAAADKYVVSEGGDIAENVAGTVGGNAALVAKQGSISGDQTIAAGGIVYLEVKDGGTLGATASGAQGNRLVQGDSQILASGGQVKVESDKVTFTDAPVVAANVSGKKVVVANAANNTSVEVGTLTGGTDQKIAVTEVLADPAGGANGDGSKEVVLAAAGTGLANAEGIKSASLEIDTGTGAITQTKKIETGETTLTAGAITLGNDGNKFGAITIANGEGAVTIREADDIVMASATHTGRLTLDAGVNSISQTGAIVLNTRLDNVGAADLTGGAITLENSGNKLGGVIVRDGQGNVSLNGGNGLAVTSIARTDGNVTLAGGEILAWPVAGESVPASISIGDGTLTLKADTRWDGTIRAGAIDAAGKTLTVRKSNDANTADIDIGGTITAATLDVDAGTVGAQNIVATTKVDQDGGQITVDETITGNVEQKGASDAVTLSAKKIDGTLTQEAGNAGVVTVGEVTGATEQNGGQILRHASADGETLKFGSTVTQHGGAIATSSDKVEITGKMTQDDATAVINASELTLKGGAEQTGAKGKVLATTLTLDNADEAVSLTSADNDFGTAQGVAAAAALVDANAIQLGEVTATGTLDVEAKGGAITQTAADKVVAGGAATLKATTDITLANAANDFQGAVNADGVNVDLKDANAIQLGEVATTGTLDVEAKGGAITQTAADKVVAGGAATLKATTDITLANAANDFTGDVTASGASVTLKDKNEINLGNVLANGDASTGNVLVETVEGTITVLEGKTVKSENANVTLTASTDDNASAGDIAVAGLVDAAKTATLTASKGSISDDTAEIGHADDVAVDPFAKNLDGTAATHKTHVKGASVELAANVDIGGGKTDTAGGTPLDIEADTVKATATDGSVYLFEKNNVTVSEISAGENAKIETAAGSITVAGNGITATEGDVLVAANGGAIEQNAAITTVAGYISVIATGKIDQKANITSGVTVDVESTGADIAINSAATTKADGNIRYKAATEVANAGTIQAESGNAVVLNAPTLSSSGTIDADSLALRADQIGESGTPFKTEVANLAAEAKTGVWIENKGDVTITSVDAANATVYRISLDSTSKEIGDDASETVTGLSTTENGPVVLETKDSGDLVVDEAVTAVGAKGNVNLTADGDIDLNAAVTAAQNATVNAKAAVNQNAGGNITATAGDAYVEAQGGDVTMADGTTTEATAGNARVAASGNVKLSSVKAGNGASVKAGGDIEDITTAEAANVTAQKARLEAGTAIGGANAADIETSVGNLELKAGTDAFVHNDKAVTIGGVDGVTVKKVKTSDASTGDVADGDLTGATATAGNLSVLADGKMTVNEAVSATAEGKNAVLETSAGDIELNAAVTAGQNATVNAKAAVNQNDGGDITATAGDAYVEAQGGDVTMADGTKTEATAGNARVAASGNVKLSSVKAGNGASVKAGTAIIDNPAAAAANVTAQTARLEAGTAIGGAAADDIDTSVDNVELVANAGDAFLQNDKAVTIGGVDGVTVKKVKTSDASTGDVADGDLTGAKAASADTGDIRIEADGNLTVSEAVATTARPTGDSTGNIRLESTGGAIAVNAAVSGNNVTLASNGKTEVSAGNKVDAAKDLYVKAGEDIVLNATGNDKAEARETMALVSDNGAIDAKALKTSVLYTQSKNGTTLQGAEVTKEAKSNSDGDIDAEFVGDATVAYNAVGHVKASATGKLTVDSAEGTDGSIKVTEVVKIDEVTDANNGVQEVDLVAADGGADSVEGVTAGTYAALKGTEVTVNKAVAANGGNAVLESTSGAVNLNDSVTASQNVTVNAKTAVNQNDGGDITATAGDVYVEAQGGDVAMADGTKTEATAGNVRVAASGNVKLSSVKAENGNVSVVATAGDIKDITAAEAANITAKNLRLEAGKAIGGANAENIDTSVDNVELVASDGDAFVHNAKGVIIGNVGAVTVQKTTFAEPTTMAGVTDNNLEGAKATTGNLSVLADGKMTVAETAKAEAAGKNAVLETTAGDIQIDAAVTAGQNATVNAKAGVVQNANITATAGDAYVEAQGGDVTMKDGTTTEATAGNARVAASGNVKLSSVKAENGNVSVKAGAAIIDNTAAETANVTAQKARLEAGTAIGGANDADIETSVGNVEIKAGTDAFVHNDKAVTVGGVNGVTVNKVAAADGSAAPAEADADLTGAEATTGNLSVLADGKMTVSEAVKAGANAALQTTADAIELNDAVTAGQNATVIAKTKVDQNANITATAGDAYVEAQGGDVTMKDGTLTKAGNNARVAASGNVKLSAVNAGQTASVKAGGSITDNTLSEAANVTAKKLRLEAGKAIGGANDADIETSVGNVEIKAGTDAFVHNTKAVTIGGVDGVTVRKVKTEDADTTDVTDGDLTGAKATAGNLSVLADGKMTVNEAVSAAADGKNAVLETTAQGIELNDTVTAGKDVTVLAKAGVTQNVAGGKKGNVIAKAGDAYVQAQGGSVTMADGTTTKAGHNARVEASENVKLSAVKAESGSVSVKAGGSITDNTASEDPNVTAKNLRLEAGKAIGGKGEGDIETSVDKIELEAKNNAYVHNAKALEIGNVGKVTVKTVTAADAKSTNVTDADLTGATSTDGDVRIVANGNLTGSEAVNAKDIRLESENGTVTLNDTVTAGKNLTIASKGKTTANAAIEATKGDLYVKAGGDIDINNGANADKGTMALVSSGGKIEADSVTAKTVYTKAKNSIKPGKMKAESAVIMTDEDFETTLDDNTKLAVSAGGNVDIHANGYTLDIGGSASGNAPLTVTEVLATGGTDNPALEGTGKGSGAVDGIAARGGSATIDHAENVRGTSITAKDDVTVDTSKNYEVQNTRADKTVKLTVGGNANVSSISGGTVDADVKGGMEAGSVSAGGDANLIVGGDAKIDDLKAGNLTADIGGSLESTKIDVSREAKLENVGGDVIVKDTFSAETLTATMIGGDVEAGAVTVKKDANLEDVRGSVTVGDLEAGSLTANIGKDLTSEKTFNVSGDANLEHVGGNATFNELTAGTLTADIGGDVIAETATVNGDTAITAGGKAEFGSFTGKKVSVMASHGIKTTGAGIKSDNLTLKGGDIDVTLDSKTISEISGGNVTIVENAHDHNVVVGTITASGNLNLTAQQIGIGNNGTTGFVSAYGKDDSRVNLSSVGDMSLDVAGFVGEASNPLKVNVGGELKVWSGGLHGSDKEREDELLDVETPLYYLYLLLTGEQDAINWMGYQNKDQSIPGLVIYRNQVLDGPPELWLRINRALAFTVETPELKSRQGVFGSPLFIHTDMDVSEAASIGSVDNISIANTSMETLADKNVRNKFFFTDKNALDYLESNASNPSRQDKLYTKEFNSDK
ncbi:MAG: filamentous hemagglutinin N-terminal domain-containing protein [Kiritimatiellae bacterium]|nr:filamentous hemagglutinin N-terminal domain-containing protein [Kiritimatiellia bacterium]